MMDALVRRWCEQNEHAPAPCGGCGCRECFRERQERLPDALKEMVQIRPGGVVSTGPSTALVNRFIDIYCGGHATYEDAMIALVKGLAAMADAAVQAQIEWAWQQLALGEPRVRRRGERTGPG
jgi:hypothetical protein